MFRRKSLPLQTASGWPVIVATWTGGFVVLLTLVVLVGWHLHQKAIVQLLPGLPAMHYGTAVFLLLCAVGLLAHVFSLPRAVTFVCGLVAGVAGWLLIAEYSLHRDLGVGFYLPLTPQIPDLTAIRPSPPTSACLALFGTALVLMKVQAIPGPIKRLVVWIACSLVLALCAMVFCGYATGLTGTYAWGNAIGMALHTAVGMATLATGLLAAHILPGQRLSQDRWLPAAVALATVIATVILWQALIAERNRAVHDEAAVVARNLAKTALSRLDAPLRSLQRMKRRLERRNGMTYEEWYADATTYIDQEKVFDCIGRSELSGAVKWIAPTGGSESLTGMNLGKNSRWDATAAFQDSANRAATVLSPALDLADGKGKACLACLPLFPQGQFDGFLIGSFRVADFLKPALEDPALKSYGISVLEGDSLIYGPPVETDNKQGTRVESSGTLQGHVWRFFVVPQDDAFRSSKLAGFVLLLGLPLAVAMALAVRGFQQTVAASHALQSSNVKLQEATVRAEAHARAKTEFLANMSHEIRTPLNAIIGMSDLLLEAGIESREREFVETIHSSGDLLLSLINDILDFSKIESGQLVLEEIPLDLRECVESALDLVAGSASKKGLDLMYWMEPGVPEAIEGDPTRLRQVLVNLLSNAIKFTTHGEIFVQVSTREAEDGKPWLQVSVRDTGIGIPENRRDRLFQAFSQVDSSTTRRYGGTGLGLAISSRLIDRMDGRMWVESEEDRGSTFHFEIPARSVDSPQETTAGPLARGSLSGLRVLIVDDNPTNRWILQMQTEGWGMTAATAESGKEALQCLENGERFHLAILDLMMPEMNGFELAEGIRRWVTPAEMPILMLTSMGEPRSDLKALGISAAMTKPLKAGPLLRAIREVLNIEPEKAGKKPVQAGGPLLASQCPLRILLAEDNPVNQRVASLLLQRMGYRLNAVANGLEVIEAIGLAKYDVILMDVQMPEMDGIQATEAIRRSLVIPAEDQPWIVALTAHAGAGDRDQCMGAGMNDYLTKPIRSEGLEAALKAAYEHRSEHAAGSATT